MSLYASKIHFKTEFYWVFDLIFCRIAFSQQLYALIYFSQDSTHQVIILKSLILINL